ncbi:MAG: helix-turn-helix domain-containing protein [archaeon GB-1867-005]|nr:helix-turn-helix domain-containing protein [Candidatus Culexmicrobium cathedralense]
MSIEEELARKIAGEIVLSDRPWITMKKWRELFNITQVELAGEMNISPSVISDYEGGRRRSPGAKFVKRFVEAIISIDKNRGSPVLREFSRIMSMPTEAILDMKEFSEAVSIKRLCQVINAEIIACSHLGERKIFGYTVVDSIRCIETLSGADFMKLMGTTSMRALIFTKVSRGRSPMVAVRVNPIKPAAVIIHGTDKVDSLAIKLARIEQIPLAVSRMPTIEKLLQALKSFSLSIE